MTRKNCWEQEKTWLCRCNPFKTWKEEIKALADCLAWSLVSTPWGLSASLPPGDTLSPTSLLSVVCPPIFGDLKAWSSSVGAVALFKQSSTSSSYVARESLGGEISGDCLTDTQQGFVLVPLWSYRLTDTCRGAKRDCMYMESYQ